MLDKCLLFYKDVWHSVGERRVKTYQPVHFDPSLEDSNKSNVNSPVMSSLTPVMSSLTPVMSSLTPVTNGELPIS